MNFITDWTFYSITIPVVLLYGMGKGGLGPAVGGVAVPMMAFVISPIQAAAILLPILCVMDIFAVLLYHRSYSFYHLKILVPAGILGIVIASLLMGYLSPDAIRVVIGVIVLWFCFDYWFKPGRKGSRKVGRFGGYFWGTIAGYTSTQIHAGGGPLSIYLLSQKLDKTILLGTIAIFMAVMNYLKLIPYTIMGAFNTENLATSLLLMPLAPIGVKIGRLIIEHVKQETIYRILYVGLFLSGLRLLQLGFF
jgi:uncharacterized protein